MFYSKLVVIMSGSPAMVPCPSPLTILHVYPLQDCDMCLETSWSCVASSVASINVHKQKILGKWALFRIISSYRHG